MATKRNSTSAATDEPNPTCGIIMPISGFDDCPEEHWYEVRQILTTAIESAGFNSVLVSDAEDIGVIQKRIIQNLYSNPIVVCDVSGKNPNVMFELGMRLAFDKPTIIVKDDKTSYTFDTSPIEHVDYPRDLRFPKIVEFQERVADKIQGTHKAATTDSSYTTFLKHFGTFSVPTIQTKEVSKEDFILEELRSLKQLIAQPPGKPTLAFKQPALNLCLRNCSKEDIQNISSAISASGLMPKHTVMHKSPGHYHIGLDKVPAIRTAVLGLAQKFSPGARILGG